MQKNQIWLYLWTWSMIVTQRWLDANKFVFLKDYLSRYSAVNETLISCLTSTSTSTSTNIIVMHILTSPFLHYLLSTKHNWNAWSLFPLCTVPKLHLALKLFLQHHLFIMCFAPQIWTLSSNFPQIWTLLSNFPQISTLSSTSRKFVAKFLSNMNTIIEIYCKIAFKDVHNYCWI